MNKIFCMYSKYTHVKKYTHIESVGVASFASFVLQISKLTKIVFQRKRRSFTLHYC